MVRVAVVGCAHGMLDDIYATVQFINEMDPARPVELLLCCGDFECMRNARDLESLACPPKYRAMHAFHRYYSGEKRAPVLTVFVGGNHEASAYLHELHYGGWVAPNMFYLGAAGCVSVGGLRLGGLSGIFKPQDYAAGRFEREPLDHSTMRSIYHVREVEVFQLSHLRRRDATPLDVFLSHDWPRGIERFGDTPALLRKKPFFRDEVQRNALGSPAGELLLYQLRPAHWFAAHLHVKFAAVVHHQQPTQSTAMEAAPPAADEAASMETPTTPTDATTTTPTTTTTAATTPAEPEMTKFLALDKCLPHREFLQVLDIPTPAPAAHQGDGDSGDGDADTSPRAPLKVFMDYEWLAILRATHHLVSSERYAPRVPDEELPIDEQDVQWVRARMEEFVREKGLDKEVGEWVSDFVKTAPAYGEQHAWTAPPAVGNPQTDLLLELLKLPHIVTTPYAGGVGGEGGGGVDVGGVAGTGGAVHVEDPNAIDIDLDDDDDDHNMKEVGDGIEQAPTAPAPVDDPNEIDLDED